MTAIHVQDLECYPDLFELGDQVHRPADAPEAVRKAWTNYLGEQASAELAFVRTIDTLRQVVTELERTAASTCRRRQRVAYEHYQHAVRDGWLSAVGGPDA